MNRRTLLALDKFHQTNDNQFWVKYEYYHDDRCKRIRKNTEDERYYSHAG